MLAAPLVVGAGAIVPIPGVHLLVIPLLICAILFGRRRWKQTERIVSVEGSCPACATAQVFPSSDLSLFPATVRCPGCGEFVKLERAPQEG